jgi:hypothetical protein
LLTTMEKKQFEAIAASLNSIDRKLDVLISLQKRSLPKPVISKEERKVFELCDKKHTNAEIATATNKTKTNVNFILSRLRDKGLIQSIDIEGKTVYEKL